MALLIISIIVFLPTLFFTKSLSGKTVGGSSGQGEYTENLKYELNVDKPGYILTEFNGGTEEVIIPPTYKGLPVFKIGEGAFFNNDKITSVVIPDSVTIIGDRAFFDCGSLTSVTIPDSVTSIGYDAFISCTSLTSVTIGNGVTSIGWCVFENCSSLTRITIPDSVTSIGESAFRSCSSLTTINYKGSKEQWDAISKGYDWNYGAGSYTINYNYVEN